MLKTRRKLHGIGLEKMFYPNKGKYLLTFSCLHKMLKPSNLHSLKARIRYRHQHLQFLKLCKLTQTKVSLRGPTYPFRINNQMLPRRRTYLIYRIMYDIVVHLTSNKWIAYHKLCSLLIAITNPQYHPQWVLNMRDLLTHRRYLTR